MVLEKKSYQEQKTNSRQLVMVNQSLFYSCQSIGSPLPNCLF